MYKDVINKVIATTVFLHIVGRKPTYAGNHEHNYAA